jgi:hypothetical protein
VPPLGQAKVSANSFHAPPTKQMSSKTSYNSFAAERVKSPEALDLARKKPFCICSSENILVIAPKYANQLLVTLTCNNMLVFV